jgi:hypothetical protein
VACDKKERLLQNLPNKTMIFSYTGNIAGTIEGAKITPNQIEIKYNPLETDVMEIIERIKNCGAHITNIVSEETKLEDIFLNLTAA